MEVFKGGYNKVFFSGFEIRNSKYENQQKWEDNKLFTVFREGENVYAAVIKPSIEDFFLFHNAMRAKEICRKIYNARFLKVFLQELQLMFTKKTFYCLVNDGGNKGANN